jgi:hypothetical protein
VTWEVISSPEFDDWFATLNDDDQERFLAARKLLEEQGPNLKRPMVGEIKSSKFSNMKELLAPSTRTTEIRALFIFDPERKAILLLAGNKAGNWDRWYNENVPVADRRYERHLADLDKRKREAQQDKDTGRRGLARQRRRR